MSKIKSALSVRVLCRMAMLIALEIVFERFLSIGTDALRIGFGFVPIVLCAVLFGPAHAAVVYAIADVIGALLFYGSCMPGITFDRALMGLMFGVFLLPLMLSDGNKLSFSKTIRMICPIAINCLILGLLLDSYWLSLISTKNSFYYLFTTRIIQYAVLIPVQLILTPFIITLAKRLRKAGIA